MVKICSRIFIIIGLALCGVAMGCSAVESDASTELDADIRISGSGTCLPLMHLLTDGYPDEDVDFVYLPGLHSGGGVSGVFMGELELGAVSRGLTPEEDEYDLVLTVISTDGLAIAVHPTAGIDALTTQQVRLIYSGAVRNWSELGGTDLPITVLDRTEDESAKIVFREHVLRSDTQITDSAVVLFYEPDMIDGVESTPGSIGYFSLGYALSTGAGVRLVTLDGIEPSVANVSDGTYDIVRELGFVTSPDAPEDILAFMEWASGAEVASLIAEVGFAPFRGR